MKYKVGDRVKVKSLQWFNENSDDKYNVVLAGGWYFSKPMSILCGKELIIDKISHVTNPPYYIMEDNTFAWTDEMIEGLVEEEAKPEPKFKVGDRVITDTNMKGKIIEVVEEGWYRVEFEPYNGMHQPNGVVPEEHMSLVEEETVHNKWTGLKVELELSKTVIDVSNVESLRGERFMSGFVKAIIPPDGYIFKDENGNVINATKIVLEKKKKEYPKTYEECCNVLSLGEDGRLYTKGYKASLIQDFQKLLICRDAYWKIAGEQMCLDKPWEPDWNDEKQDKHGFYNEIKYTIINPATLVFPTAKMRDVFYGNFKELIEQCKKP